MDLLHRYARTFDRSARHVADIRADAPAVLGALREANFARSRVLALLLEKVCDAAVLDLQRASWAHGLTLDALQSLGCIVLRSKDEHELGLGSIVAVSSSRTTLLRTDARTFCSFSRPDSVKILAHFHVASSGTRRSRLTLETRVRACDGPDAGRILRRWDAFARLGALGRREVLAAIKAHAEVWD